LSKDEKNLEGKITSAEVRAPSSYHSQIQMIKHSKNDHERTSDDNDDV
jgi:hypothetical protein